MTTRTVALVAALAAAAPATAQVTTSANYAVFSASLHCNGAWYWDSYPGLVPVPFGAAESVSVAQACGHASTDWTMTSLPDRIDCALISDWHSAGTPTAPAYVDSYSFVNVAVQAPSPVPLEVVVTTGGSGPDFGAGFSYRASNYTGCHNDPGPSGSSCDPTTTFSTTTNQTFSFLNHAAHNPNFHPYDTQTVSGSASVHASIRALGSATRYGTDTGVTLSSYQKLDGSGDEFLHLQGPASANLGLIAIGNATNLVPTPFGCDLLIDPLLGSVPVLLTNGELLMPVAAAAVPATGTLTLQAATTDGVGIFCSNGLQF